MVYKKSQYEVFIKKSYYRVSSKKVNLDDLLNNHKYHYRCINNVFFFLDMLNKSYIGLYINKLNKNTFFDKNFIICVGGDGTILYANNFSFNGLLLGVNSSRNYSVGLLCVANNKNFKKYILQYLNNIVKSIYFCKMQVIIDKKELNVLIMNDILFSSVSSAGMSNYIIKKL